MNDAIAFEVKMNVPYETALEKVTEALKTEGFGVLTHIDVKATMKEKMNADFRSYSILGACNPPLAHRALSRDAKVGLMLPCNITVESTPQGGSIVRIADPEIMISFGDFKLDAELREVAEIARQKLANVSKELE